MANRRDKYQCCRCGYETYDRSCMRRHLLCAKKPCPASRNVIELTDEIKEWILDNRVYHIPKEEKPIQPIQQINNIINYNNTVNNLIASMDVIEKLNKYAEYNNIEIQDFEECVEEKYSSKVKKLENNRFKYGFSLKQQDLLDIFDEVTNKSSVEDLNLIFDSKYNKFKIFVDGKWKEMLASRCIQTIVETVQSHLLNSYEVYLIRQIKSPETNMVKKQEYKGHLGEYYKFIGAFDISPFVKGRNDNKIKYNDNDDEYYDSVDAHDVEKHQIIDEYLKLYDNIRTVMTISEMNTIKKQVFDIVKKNSTRNIEDLNKKIFDLFCRDDEFKENIIKN